ncbi:hypothetical protein GM661_12520 [Iocasia frigidifontis]|uniref:Antitoxin SocA-like Panacea domain-containing protein n=1 Tax=Iocasia fonsfrigidae TaxID=2682810 RepID=A0A8A7KBX1_9FIRM|nr:MULTISPECIES: hypothetical protein [Halanaerobiaceae]AZO95858.1 hypothetical protein D7D81_15375 [Halocella sp. SP3-1]QTL98730.1 hypothetical protein GM661_12520 [Iocasia fonsfrigidae]
MDNSLKYTLLVEISREMSQRDLRLSKMFLQKMVFLLQALYSFPTAYEFKLYTYGPYSIELINDLDYLFATDFLVIDYIQEGEYIGSSITPGIKYSKVISCDEESIAKYREKISLVIDLFGNYTEKELELRAALVFLLNESQDLSITRLVEKVQEKKPYFTKEEIKNAYNDLIDMDILN